MWKNVQKKKKKKRVRREAPRNRTISRKEEWNKSTHARIEDNPCSTVLIAPTHSTACTAKSHCLLNLNKEKTTINNKNRLLAVEKKTPLKPYPAQTGKEKVRGGKQCTSRSSLLYTILVIYIHACTHQHKLQDENSVESRLCKGNGEVCVGKREGRGSMDAALYLALCFV